MQCVRPDKFSQIASAILATGGTKDSSIQRLGEIDMKRSKLFSTLVAGLGLATVFGSHAFAVGPAVDPVVQSQWDENAYYSGFGGAAPAGLVEYSAGFSTIGDYDGRVLSNSGVTKSFSTTTLTTISTGLFSGTDANLYEISITNPATFTASLPSTSLILALFSANGTGLAASIGTPITGAAAGVTSPGLYYIGLANSGMYPQNAENLPIFGGLAGGTGIYTPTSGDAVLGTDGFTAWTTPGDGNSAAPNYLTNTSFVAGGSTITLTGAGFAVVPEPASIGLLGVGALGLLGRRRRQAGSK
jgi:PEP-CTERM motif